MPRDDDPFAFRRPAAASDEAASAHQGLPMRRESARMEEPMRQKVRASLTIPLCSCGDCTVSAPTKRHQAPLGSLVAAAAYAAPPTTLKETIAGANPSGRAVGVDSNP